jgi:hypothetical protein
MQKTDSAIKKPRKKHVASELTKQFLIIRAKPKKPQNAFVLYSIDRRHMLLDIHGGAAKMKKLGEDWNKATPREKNKYQERAEPGRLAHVQAMDEWNTAFKKFKDEHTVKGASKPFILFRSEMNRKRKSEGHANIDGKEISALAKEEWAELTDDQKQVYVTAAQKDIDRYNNEMASKRDILISNKPSASAPDQSTNTKNNSESNDDKINNSSSNSSVNSSSNSSVNSNSNSSVNSSGNSDSSSIKKKINTFGNSKNISGSSKSIKSMNSGIKINDNTNGGAEDMAKYTKLINSSRFKLFVKSQESHIRASQKRPINEHELLRIAYKMWIRDNTKRLGKIHDIKK